AGAHLRRFPLRLARGLDVGELASVDSLALADVALPASGVEEGLEPGLPIAVNRPLRSTQPSPRGSAAQLELRPSPPVGERDIKSGALALPSGLGGDSDRGGGGQGLGGGEPGDVAW